VIGAAGGWVFSQYLGDGRTRRRPPLATFLFAYVLVVLAEELQRLDADQPYAAALTAANDAVMQVYQRVGQAMVQNQQAAAPTGEPAGEGSTAGAEQSEPDGDDDVVEGEIVDEGGAS